MIQTSAIFPIPGCFIIETAKRTLSGKPCHQCKRMSCSLLSSNPTGSFTVSPFLVSSSHALEQFFFIILFVTSSKYMFSPSVLLLPCFEQAKCLYCEIFNPLQSVTLQLDEMSAVQLYYLYYRIREKNEDLLINKNLNN